MFLRKKRQIIRRVLFCNKKISCLQTPSAIQKIFFKLMFIFLSLLCLSCRFTPEITSRGGRDNIGDTPTPTNPGNPTEPVAGGKIVSDCNQNSSYNACIYKKNPIAQSGNALNRSGDVLLDLTNIQTYAVQITGTDDDLLKNSHFDIDVGNTGSIGVIDTVANSIVNVDIGTLIIGPSYFNPEASVVERVRLSNGKWTTAYSSGDHSVEQVMSYYWLMYQHDWMKENASTFYASNKNVKVSAFSSVPGVDEFKAYFSPLENKIALGIICDITSGSFSCDPPIGVGLSAEIIIHEAGHANIHHSIGGALREGLEPGCQTHVACESRNSLCELSEDEILEAQRCCDTEKGCFFAIDEGQADFHAAILFPNSTVVGEMFQNSTQGISGCFPSGGLSRGASDPITKNANTEQVFNNCSNHNGPGEIHLMGILYNSIWWEVYRHKDTEESDILKLFTEHLPILHFGDDFETAGSRIMSLARQLFDASKADKYANIIQSEFERRGLNPVTSDSL